MLELFPDIRPYDERRLDVGDGHVLYIEQCGEPTGLPVLVLHGGPGAGCQGSQRRFFDPRHYRIILVDQRGAGRSTPHASLDHNTTAHLLTDLEKVREALQVDRWVVFGGTFGATLALLYAQRHPERVLGLLLRGVLLARPQDLDWYFGGGAAQIFPDAWAQFLRYLPEAERDNPIEGYYRRLTGEDEIARLAAARNWGSYAARIRTLYENNHLRDQYHDIHRALSVARIACHYAKHRYFLKPDEVLERMSALTGIPGILVHGRYDMVSPLANAFAVQSKWLDSEILIVRGAGHVATEAPTVDALIHATRQMHRQITRQPPDVAD